MTYYKKEEKYFRQLMITAKAHIFLSLDKVIGVRKKLPDVVNINPKTKEKTANINVWDFALDVYSVMQEIDKYQKNPDLLTNGWFNDFDLSVSLRKCNFYLIEDKDFKLYIFRLAKILTSQWNYWIGTRHSFRLSFKEVCDIFFNKTIIEWIIILDGVNRPSGKTVIQSKTS